MTHKERRFAVEYPRDGDGTAAAIRAGYAPRHAKTTASRLLRRPQIRFAIGRAFRDRAARTGATRERVLLELARLAFADLAGIASWGADGRLTLNATLSDDAAAAILELGMADSEGKEPRLRLHDKGFALELLARYFGLCEPAPPAGDAGGARAMLMARIARLADDRSDEAIPLC